jgi:hypothetical protein
VLVFLFLLLAMAAVAAGSSYYAVLAIQQRDRAEQDRAQTSQAMEALVSAAASSSKLKGPANAQAREEVLQPALKYYQELTDKYGGDEQMLPEVAKARLQLAALQAKLGSPTCVTSLGDGLQAIHRMLKVDSFAEEDYPGFQAIVLRVVAPTDWIQVKTDDMAAYGVGLYFAIASGTDAYQQLADKYPKSVRFRDDLSALLQASAMLQSALPGRGNSAAASWVRARDVLETLVRDQPSNLEFQTRLADSLTNAARLQATKEMDQALVNMERAVEVRQRMADANPDDQSLAKDLATAKSILEKLEAKAASAKVASQEEVAKEDPPKKDAPTKEAPQDEVPPAEAPKAEASPEKAADKPADGQ